MFVVTHRKYFYIFSGLLVALSFIAMFAHGLNLGIDFKGGSLLEVGYASSTPAMSDVQKTVTHVTGTEPSVRPIGDNGYLIRTRSLSEPEHQVLLKALSNDAKTPVDEKRFDSIGPLLGSEAAHKSLISIVLVIIAIICFIAFAFRKVSQPVASWKYGIITIVALLHDVLVPTGVFVVLGHFNPVIEIDTLFVTALLVILGFSVHDTIVVFDRVRENLKYSRKASFAETVGTSISQTFVRSINTSLTVVFSLIVLYFLGGAATQNFTLALLIGVVAGTYSSIFIGSPLLVTVEKWQNRKK